MRALKSVESYLRNRNVSADSNSLANIWAEFYSSGLENADGDFIQQIEQYLEENESSFSELQCKYQEGQVPKEQYIDSLKALYKRQQRLEEQKITVLHRCFKHKFWLGDDLISCIVRSPSLEEVQGTSPSASPIKFPVRVLQYP